MKKVHVVLVVGLLIFCSVVSAESFTIRNGIKIGDSKETVMSLETLVPISDTKKTLIELYNGFKKEVYNQKFEFDSSEYIYYGPGPIAGIPDSKVEYHFIDDHLTCVAYQFREDDQFVDYPAISKALNQKYGDPTSNGEYPILGMAGKYGAVRYIAMNNTHRGWYADVISEEWVISAGTYDVLIEHIILVGSFDLQHCLSYSVVNKLDIPNVDPGDI